MIPARFDYVRPATIEAALAALADPDAKALAGGHSLLPAMKVRLARPSLLVDLGGLGLAGVEEMGGTIVIGALATYADAATALAGIGGADALRECLAAVGDVQVRNAGTVGGSLAHADPASDVAAGVLALGGSLRLRSASGERDVPAEAFLLGPFQTALEPQELVVSVAVARTGDGEGSAYTSVEDPASGYPLAGIAARVARDGDAARSCTVAATGFTAVPRRLEPVEALVLAAGGPPAAEAVTAALENVAVLAEDTAYRTQLAAVAASRAIERAWQRAGGEA